MIGAIEIGGKTYRIDFSKEIDISIPVSFDNNQFIAFGAEPASSRFYGGKDFTVSVESGTGCNCPVFTFSAHLHGTHTECVGHISKQDHIIQETALIPPFINVQLITVAPVPAKNCGESYKPEFDDNDMVITKVMLQQKFNKDCEALVIRTMPNSSDKLTRDYDKNSPPFFTNEAMDFIVEKNVQHLLVDMPSIDRLHDDGLLSNHHIFWNVEQGSHNVAEPSPKTITEFIYVPDTISDGNYVLNLNIGNIRSDATPSRPVLYEVLS